MRPARLLSLVFVGLTGCAAPENPWGRVRIPSMGVARALGGYAAGCLGGAQSLPPDGAGYQVMRLSRNRFYGHPDLIRFLRELGEDVAENRLGVLLIGDMAQPRGGPMFSGHASHQVGLDVDIWYWYPSRAEKESLRLDERETTSAVEVVTPDGAIPDPHSWSERNAQILRLVAEFEQVERVFVHPAIKRELCRLSEEAEWLRKIRPWWGHADHFHVRLTCPGEGSPHCTPQEPPPGGSGCDQTLDWWFSEEAKREEVERSRKKRRFPELPPMCAEVLNDEGRTIQAQQASPSL